MSECYDDRLRPEAVLDAIVDRQPVWPELGPTDVDEELHAALRVLANRAAPVRGWDSVAETVSPVASNSRRPIRDIDGCQSTSVGATLLA